MTVSAQTPINRSTGNGVTTVFPYTFKIISDADIEVTVDDVVKTLNVDYTVSGAGVDAGGNVTMTVAPANATSVVRRRNMALVRSTDYQDQGELPATTLDNDIDATVLMVQQLDERLDRTFSLPASFSGDSTLPAPEPGYLIGWDATGENLTNIPASVGSSLVDLAAPTGSSLVGYLPAGAGAVATDVQSKLRERVSVSDFGAVGDGVTNDYAAIQAAHDSLSAAGGEIYFPSGLYSIATKLRITKRNVRFIGENSYNTYILPTAAVVDAPIHVMGFAFELANFTVYSPAGVGGYCVWSRGAGDLYVHDNVFLNGGPINTGYAVVLEDVNEVSTFVPGAYRHRFHRNTIGPYNNYFSYGIITGYGCTGGGMNACVFSENQMICYNGFSIAKGGGNTYFGNLLQSATGGNSGVRPFTGGAGYGFIFGGESHFVGNYCERFLVDFYQSSSSATYSVTGHSSDASNEVYVGQSGLPSPAEVVTGYGVSAEKLDIQPTVTITADGTTLRTDRRAITLLGNAGQYTGLILSAVGAKEGQLITVYNNSYAMQFASGGAMDLTGWGSQLVLGQQGLSLLNVTTQGNWADFIFTASNTWKLLNVGTHGNLIGGTLRYSFSGNGETLPTLNAYIDITGAGDSRSGALLTAGTTYGQSLTLTANSWSVAFAAGAAMWSASGAPTMGNGVGQVQAMQLVYTASGWIEVSRSTRP